jgi:hypothetical protein
VTEWENPIWGWLVVNYADRGGAAPIPQSPKRME